MSQNDKLLTDDFVADLLAKEANDCSIKYSAMGMEAYRPNKKPANIPKPNTRFLRHIIKDTDTHNKALLAKEAAESKARLSDLERAEERKRLKTNPNARDVRRRQMGDIQAILGGKKRPHRVDTTKGPAKASSSKDRRKPHAEDLFDRASNDRLERGRLSRIENSDVDRESRQGGKHPTGGRRRGNSSSEDDSRSRRARKIRDQDRHRGGGAKRRSRSPGYRAKAHRQRSPILGRKGSSESRKGGASDDSDPLEELIGPAPPPRYRGRGVLGSSGIDRRFSESYDPKTDVAIDEGGAANGWDEAVEAFRDRQKLKQSQEQRMLDAGFTSEQVKRAAGEDDPEMDVKWTKAGEERDWDRGKVDGADEVLDTPFSGKL